MSVTGRGTYDRGVAIVGSIRSSLVRDMDNAGAFED